MRKPVPVVLLREDKLKRSRISETVRGVLILVLGPALVLAGALLIWML